ncbi:hypothetical protein GW17_00036714 [Ensete ventricosum]|nr:hypothetical protein GW17_00036714 [Ensete ventricosum]
MEWLRRSCLVAVAVVVVLLVAWRGVEGSPEEDLVVILPGQPKVGFRQYAGHVDVDVKAGRSLFYYFAEADGDAHRKPLTLWLNGGGCLVVLRSEVVHSQSWVHFTLEGMDGAFK